MIEKEDATKCKICCDFFNAGPKKAYSINPCGHYYCISCINKLPAQTCPHCRGEIKNITINRAILDILDTTTSNTIIADDFIKEVEITRNKVAKEKQKKELLILEDFVKISNELDQIKKEYESLKNRPHEVENALKMSMLIRTFKFKPRLNVGNSIGGVKFSTSKSSGI